jgi:anti-sigma factor RsiW
VHVGKGSWERIRKRREHRWSWRRTSDYVDGDLGPAESRRLARHADGCEECGPLVRSLLRLIRALRALGPPARAGVEPGVLERLRSGEFSSTGPDGAAAR